MVFETQQLFERSIQAEFSRALELWPTDGLEPELWEVPAAILGRQGTLACGIAWSPGLWNPHVGPILLRSMIEVHIMLMWILEDRELRVKKYIDYGLGQQKLASAHREEEFRRRGCNPEDDPLLKADNLWILSQKYPWLVDVNLGSWSGIDTRKMATEAGCLDLYNFTYVPFSAAVHSQWHHVGKFNSIPCEEFLHGSHCVPHLWGAVSADAWWLLLAAKYWAKSYDQCMKKIEGTKLASGLYDIVLSAVSHEHDEGNGS